MLRTRSVLVSLLVGAALVVETTTAEAEAPKVDYADGIDNCREFDAKNERELADWSSKQAPVPYKYERDDYFVNAPWGHFLHEAGKQYGLVLATVIPHVGAQVRLDEPAAVVSWPWTFPLFPATACSRTRGTFVVDKYRSHRLMLEPGIVSSNRGTGFFTRPGYRFLYHPTDWVVGVGGGLGTTIELSGQREPFRASLGPEAVVQFGHCCEPSYFTFAIRFDHYFAGNVKDVFGGSLGYTFF